MSEEELVGRVLVNGSVTLCKLLRDSAIQTLDPIVGHRLLGVRRRAKVLMFDFDSGMTLVMHMKLSGQWAIRRPDGRRRVAGHPVPKPAQSYPHRATHAVLTFDDGTTVYYSDIRQFGWWRLLPTPDVDALIASFGFGPEGTEPLDPKAFAAALSRRTIPIKTLLLDQSFVAGLGNIYVDEVLFAARIHPATPANNVSAVKRNRIVAAIPVVLAEGIRQEGATIINSIAVPENGFPAVHGREGQPCVRCGTPIRKIRVGARGTYFCPNCQQLPWRARVASAGTGGD